MKILHVIASVAPRYGGPTVAVLSMCEGLVARGHEVEILTTNVDGDGELPVTTGRPTDIGGVRVFYFPIQRPRTYGTSFALGGALRRKIPAADVVHIHSLYLFHGLVGGRRARRADVPYVLRPHGTLDRYHREHHVLRKRLYDALVERKNLDRAAAIHCVSEHERRGVLEAGVRAPIVVIPHGIDTALYAPATAARTVDAEPPLVAFIGRITPKKRLDLLLDAVAWVNRRSPLKLAVAGPGDLPSLAWLRSRIAELGLQKQVLLLGLLDRDSKIALLRNARLFVLASEDENFGIAVAEAMSTGVPVVVSRNVGLAPEISAANAGIVVDLDVPSLSGAIERLILDPDEAAILGANGRAHALRTFGTALVAQRLEDLYMDVVAA